MDRAAAVRSPLETMTRCRIDHTAIGAGGSIELCRPVGQIETRLISEVATVLSEADAAGRGRGRYVAGFVAYEAAPAFDARARVNTPSSMAPSSMAPSSMAPSSMAPSSMAPATSAVPLAWFGIFVEAVPAPAVCSPGAGFVKPRPRPGTLPGSVRLMPALTPQPSSSSVALSPTAMPIW